MLIALVLAARIITSGADAEGRYQIQVYPDVTHYPPSGEVIESVSFTINNGFAIVKVDSFFATDRGGVVEGVQDLYTNEGFILMSRSEHKESGREMYDAIKSHYLRFVPHPSTILYYRTRVWSTNGMRGNALFGLIVTLERNVR
jgi:hypothetical protein